MVGVASLLPTEWRETETHPPPTGPCKYLKFPRHSGEALLVTGVPLPLAGEGQNPGTCPGVRDFQLSLIQYP